MTANGSLPHGDGGHKRDDRCRRGLILAILLKAMDEAESRYVVEAAVMLFGSHLAHGGLRRSASM